MFSFIIFICFLILSSFIFLFKRTIKQKEQDFIITSSFRKNEYKSDTDNILKPYIKAQNDFCENPNKYINQKYEDEIILFDVKLNELKYQMYAASATRVIKSSHSAKLLSSSYLPYCLLRLYGGDVTIVFTECFFIPFIVSTHSAIV